MSRYSSIKELKTSEGISYRANPIYPDIAPSEDDVYVITVDGDRYDTLSYQFYGTVDYWWIIASVNSNVVDGSLVLKPGIQIRIPASPESYRQKFNDINS